MCIVSGMNTPLTPLDGRYYDSVKDLVAYLSEDALIVYRVKVELAWLVFLGETVGFEAASAVKSLAAPDIAAIKEIESRVKHDVKAVEMWIGEQLQHIGRDDLVPYVHFGRTSEDINNIAYALMLRDARDKVMIPAIDQTLTLLESVCGEAKLPMLAHTHGQPATPTTLNKELSVFTHRLSAQKLNIQLVAITAKCNGATGTMAADMIAYPAIDWQTEMQKFVTSLGLEYTATTTQIEPHDWIARLSNENALFNTISIDLCRDIWQYISMGYLKQRVVSGEVGSSTMPHKVNPIHFENAEANFGLANALFRHFAEKLPISRLQRDLSDSSVLRAQSEAYGHMLVALTSLRRGLQKIEPDAAVMSRELDAHWELLTEAVQTVMRKHGIADAYEQMKQLSRGQKITKESLHEAVQQLAIPDDDKQRLLALTPQTYVGNA